MTFSATALTSAGTPLSVRPAIFRVVLFWCADGDTPGYGCRAGALRLDAGVAAGLLRRQLVAEGGDHPLAACGSRRPVARS